jgi:hypothetical protein
MIALALKEWKLIGWGVTALLLAGALWGWSSASKARDKANQALGSEQTRHAVTRQSVATLEGIIAAKNEEARRRAAEYEAAKGEAVKEAAASDARFAATEARRAYLARLVAQTPGKPCPVPDGLLSALGDLE